MTEEEWAFCNDPGELIGHVSDRRSHHMKVLKCACLMLRHVWDWVEDERSRNVVRATERYAEFDKRVTLGHVFNYGEKAREAMSHQWAEFDESERTVLAHVAEAAANLHEAALGGSQERATRLIVERTACTDPADPYCPVNRERQVAIIRDLFGTPHPFPQVVFQKEWRTSTAVGLAQAIYDDRAFDRLPILADALQDAGCEDADVLAHCRGDGPHVRGCWVVDLVLGKQ